MKLLCITDIHGERAVFEEILRKSPDCDAVLLGGDITNFGTPDQAESFIKLAASSFRHVLAVAGNCDSRQIDERISKLGVSLFGVGTTIDGIGFLGCSAMPPWTGSMYELTEQEMGNILQRGNEQVGDAAQRVVLSHTPPHGCLLDDSRRAGHVGSHAVREFVDSTQPDLLVCGHIHEARGTDTIGSTVVVNCGPALEGNFAVAHVEEGIRVELF